MISLEYKLKGNQYRYQAIDDAIRTAQFIIQSNDLVAYKDLNVKGMVKNRKLAKDQPQG